MAIRKRSWTAPRGEAKTAWLVDYRDQAGKRRSKQFARKKDAEAWRVGAAWQVSQGLHTHDSDSITVAKASELWLDFCRAEQLEPLTIAGYDQHVRLHILPMCGNVKLSQLTTPIVEGYRDQLTAKLSRPMAIRVLRALKAIIAESMRVGRVAQNVAQPVKMARAKRSKPKPAIPSKKALKAILEAATASDNPMTLPLHCIAIFGGLRASELRGAAWSSLHLKSASIEVTQRADATGRIGPPKSEAGHRVIPLPDMAIKALKAWKLACPVTDDNLIFPSLAGKVMSWNYMLDHLVGPVQIAAGEYNIEGKRDLARKVPRWGLHGFRHAAASLWIDQNVNAKRVQYLMGHSNIAVTFDTYGHLFEQVEKDVDTSAAIERAIFADAT